MLIIFIALVAAFFIERKIEDAALERALVEEETKKNYLMGKFDPAAHEDFKVIPKNFIVEVMQTYTLYLREEVLDAFTEMRTAARKEGVELVLASATRNFDYQKDLWEKRWQGLLLVNKQKLSNFANTEERFEKNLEYTALPGTSRHHWGTDIDIGAANLAYYETAQGKKEHEWLLKNARSFGFCQPYKPKGVQRATGYNEEKWHWSYLPTSRIYTEEYKNLVKNEDIRGFSGDQFVPGKDIVNNYVMSIRPDCI